MMISKDAGLFNRASSHYTNAIEDAIKQLLQSKHLYQSQEVVLPPIDFVIEQSYKNYLAGIVSGPGRISKLPYLEETFNLGKKIYWTINENLKGVSFGVNEEILAIVDFTPPTVRLYCSHCDYLQPYNYLNGESIFKDFERESARKDFEAENTPRIIIPGTKDKTDEIEKRREQVFLLVYQCQGCKGLPEVFLIRRNGMKFILSGRTPMEKVIVEPFIPKHQRGFYSDAIIAYNAGQILPGIFMLRTFLEQFVRSSSTTPQSTNIEALFDEYNATLPEDFKSRFPSLRKIYDNLSEDIHGAIGSAELFDKSKEEIDIHFDARRLYRIN
jgi:hypothetical protein